MSVTSIVITIERHIVYKKVIPKNSANKKSLELMLTNKLHIISTIGSNAPYVGLLGTVLRIMMTFSTIGQQEFMDTGKIMVGLALALKETAIGLLVAIPAIVLHDFLLRRVRVIITIWEIVKEQKGA